MAVLLFPDNTVLINFAIINRMDLLERLANGNGHWCATVASECDSSAQKPGLSSLANAKDIFGSPWSPDAAELQDARLGVQERSLTTDHEDWPIAEVVAASRSHSQVEDDLTDRGRRVTQREGYRVVSSRTSRCGLTGLYEMILAIVVFPSTVRTQKAPPTPVAFRLMVVDR